MESFYETNLNISESNSLGQRTTTKKKLGCRGDTLIHRDGEKDTKSTKRPFPILFFPIQDNLNQLNALVYLLSRHWSNASPSIHTVLSRDRKHTHTHTTSIIIPQQY
jgi:hypothetical protein